MTRKHYNKSASLIRQYVEDYGQEGVDDIIDLFVELFSHDNPRFNEKKFRTACLPRRNTK
jgi:hypothetical protein